MVGWFAAHPAARSILRRTIEELGEDAGGKDEAALKLLTYASAMPEGAAVTVDEGVVPALIKLLESGARSARHAGAAQCLQVLTRMLPKRTASKGDLDSNFTEPSCTFVRTAGAGVVLGDDVTDSQ